MTRRDLIRKLVTTGHLNVPERATLGRPTIARAELLPVISEVLAEHGYFPPQARPWTPGTAVYEGHLIEALGSGFFRIHLQRHLATSPGTLAHASQSDFDSIEAAVDAYVALAIGADLDGIPID